MKQVFPMLRNPRRRAAPEEDGAEEVKVEERPGVAVAVAVIEAAAAAASPALALPALGGVRDL